MKQRNDKYFQATKNVIWIVVVVLILALLSK